MKSLVVSFTTSRYSKATTFTTELGPASINIIAVPVPDPLHEKQFCFRDAPQLEQ